jgi:hypothetical protein
MQNFITPRRHFRNGGMMRRLVCLTLAIAFLTLFVLADENTFLTISGILAANTGNYYSGTLTSNTTWTGGPDTIRLTSDLKVPQGVTLTIKPGVTVDFSYHRIYIEGTLVAKGLSGSKIVFTGSVQNPYPGAASPG